MGCLNNEYPLLWVIRVEGNKRERKQGNLELCSELRNGSGWAREEQGHHPRDESHRVREGREGMLGGLTSPTGTSVPPLSCLNSPQIPHHACLFIVP